MNCCRETWKMGVPPGNRRVLDSVLEQYVAGSDTRGRPEGRPYPWSQQVIHEISGLGISGLLTEARVHPGEPKYGLQESVSMLNRT
jgi:hypothetical protein